MVKYSDDPDFTHEQMELSTAYDLRYARLVHAQIDSINSAENCAAITLTNGCAELEGKSVEAVPFFYHCENASGTLEELARGHEAFIAGDFVLVLWVPASGDVDEQFCIFGHADKRGTQRCNFELLYIKTGGTTSSGYAYCLFNASSGDVLDIESFENIDELSPPKPSSAIGIGSVSVDDWVNYNFTDVVPAITMPYYSNVPYTEPIELSDFDTAENITSETVYTGSLGFMTSSTPVDCSTWFDPGNSVYSVTASRPITEDTDRITGTQTLNIHKASPFGGQITPNNCRAAWGHTTYSLIDTYQSTSNYVKGISLTDGVTWDVVDMGVSFISTRNKSITTDLSTSGSFMAEVEFTKTLVMETSFAGFPQLNKQFNFSASLMSSYTKDSWPPYGSQEQLPRGNSRGYAISGKYGSIEDPYITPDLMGPYRPIKIGSFGTYCIAGAAICVHRFNNTTETLSVGTVNSGGTGDIGIASCPQDGIGYSFSDYYASIQYIDGVEYINPFTTEIFIAPFAIISPFTGDFGAGGTATLTEFFGSANNLSSIALGEAVSTMFNTLMTRVSTLGYTIDQMANFYNDSILQGASIDRILKRKG